MYRVGMNCQRMDSGLEVIVSTPATMIASTTSHKCNGFTDANVFVPARMKATDFSSVFHLTLYLKCAVLML